MICKILEQLEKIDSTNAKVEFLKDNSSDLLKRVLYLALNKYYRYGFKEIPMPYPETEKPSMSLDDGLDFIELELKGNQRSTQRTLDLAKVLGKLSNRDGEVIRRVILKDLQCGIAIKLVNKAFKKLIPEFDVLLAKPGKEKNLKNLIYPCFAQIKYDGGRVNLDIDNDGEISAFTRTGNLMELHGRFDGQFPENANHSMIDGELLAYDKNGNRIPRKKSNGIITKAVRGTLTKAESKCLRFVAWDMVDRDNFIAQEPQMTPCKARYENVKELLTGCSDIISVAECRIVNSFEEALAYFEECIENGEEGIILKNLHGIWELKRSNDLVKMKAEKDADLVIVALNEGDSNGNRAGKLGSFVLETRCGKLRVNCGSGLSKKQVVEYWNENMIGKIVEMTYNELIESESNDKMSMFLPIFQEVRFDKNRANSLEDLL